MAKRILFAYLGWWHRSSLLVRSEASETCANDGSCDVAARGPSEADCSGAETAENGWWSCHVNSSRAEAWRPRDEGAHPLGVNLMVADAAECEGLATKVLSPLLPIEAALAARTNRNKVFIMRNGENHGVFATYFSGCHLSLARTAALHLGATFADVSRPMRFFTTSGRAVGDNATDVMDAAEGLLHLLLEGEAWVWPGVRVGFRWLVDGIELETVALAPRVFLVRNVTTVQDAVDLIENGPKTMSRSPEKHYSPGFENYRTSQTGYFSRTLPVAGRIREITQRVTRLETINHVEQPQLLLYKSPEGDGEFGDWYKSHRDIYHNFKPKDESPVKTWVNHVLASASRFEESDMLKWPKPAAISRDRWDALPKEERVQLSLSAVLLSANEVERNAATWIEENIGRGSRGFLQALLNYQPDLFVPARTAFELAMGSTFKWDAVKRFVQPNRHATMLFYLNEVLEGGETVFPLAETPPGQPVITRKGLHDCSSGLFVPPLALGAALFYHKFGNGTNDLLSTHAGCPPVRGEKWAINSFMWNVPADEGYRYYRD